MVTYEISSNSREIGGELLCVVEVSGDVIGPPVGIIAQHLTEAIECDCAGVVLDLSEVGIVEYSLYTAIRHVMWGSYDQGRFLVVVAKPESHVERALPEFAGGVRQAGSLHEAIELIGRIQLLTRN